MSIEPKEIKSTVSDYRLTDNAPTRSEPEEFRYSFGARQLIA
jgi:hypothetical protein